MAYWSNSEGGNWSVLSNWLFSTPPGSGDLVVFVSGPLTAPSVIDPAYANSVLGPITLQPGVILDVQKSVSTPALTYASADGSGQDGGLIEVGNGAVLTLESDLVNQGIYIQGDGIGTEGTFVVAGSVQGGGQLTLDGVDFSTTVGIDDTTGQFVTLQLQNGATYTAAAGTFFDAGTIDLAGNAEANFAALTAGELANPYGSFVGQVVTMIGSNNELVLPNTPDGRSLAITGFGISDRIEIAGLSVASASYSNGALSFYAAGGGLLATLTNVSLQVGLPSSLDASHFSIGSDSTGSYVLFASCFVPGTRILTPGGEVPVERLREGDLVMTRTAQGLVPARASWIGRRRIDLRSHPYPWMVAPIRILRSAFADNVPHRDLVLSPDHCIAVDGRLVPAKMLVNNATILREEPAAVLYLHVECETHSLILAEGLAVESYLDTGNRAMFENAGMGLLLHPDFAVNRASRSWDQACAPLAVDPAVVQPMWQRLADRARDLGLLAPAPVATTEEAELCVIADGCRLCPVAVRDGRHVFLLPSTVSAVTLQSRTARPAGEQPWSGDERRLGVAVRQILLRGAGEVQVLAADDAALRRGWWPAESDGTTSWRWTDGAGVVTLDFPVRMIEVELAMTARYPLLASGAGWLRAA